jgi:hypothetical protein
MKIFLTVRNRLSITKKCIKAIQRHSTLPYQLYIYDNQTNYKVADHFAYYCKLYQKGDVTQLTFNTDASTFNAFSKATSCNMFGKQHQQDPEKDKIMFMVMLDNDIIVTPGWDKKLLEAWKYVIKNKIENIKIIGQLPGGIKNRKQKFQINEELIGRVGKLGGSGLWSVRSNFFDDVGFLDLKLLVGHSKKHDQLYWRALDQSTGGQPYIMGLNTKLGIHCGRMSGSVCNKLTQNKGKSKDHKLELVKFKDADEKIGKMEFNEFYKKIIKDTFLNSDW